MRDDLDFRVAGSGGGGKGKGSRPKDAENTLRSKARARMVEVISEGVIEGLVDGAKSIYFEETPLQNPDGSYNFNNVLWTEHKGLPDEPHFNGITAVETPNQVEVQVKQATGPVQRTIVDQNADAVRVILRIPALFFQDRDKGNMKTASLSYRIQVRSYQGVWVTAVENHIRNEKCVSPYQIAHRVELPFGGAPWDVRVIRISPDSEEIELQNDLWWESYITLVEGKFTYPNTAAVAMEVNAEDMGTNIPARSFRVRGIRVLVPSNYDPITRTYTGIWDGTFKRTWTNNPAWIFHDLLTNDRYGLGEFVPAEIVDKWSLYTIAQYCDQLVPSGYKNGDTGEDIMEPRFTYNGVINTRDEAYFVLQQVATAWRGMAYWCLGQVFATADMPSDPVKLVSPANVIGGEFHYSGTAMKARHSVCIVKWNDPQDFYRQATEVVINDEMLKRYGWREKVLQLQGCTSRGLAHRYGKWVLDVEQHENETVEYQASWDHADVRPGNIIAISDPNKAQARLGGRIKSYDAATRTVTLDYPFEPTPNETYSLMAVLPDGKIETKAITSYPAPDQVVLAEPYSQAPLVDAMFAVTGTDIRPRQYRVIAMEEVEKNIFKITALFHDPNKYDRVERDIVFDPIPYSRPRNVAYPPTNLQVREVSYTLNGTTRSRLLFSWTPNPNMLARRFHVTVETPYDGVLALGDTDQSWIELDDIVAGTYVFSVQAVSYTGMMSEPATFEYEATGPEGIPLGTVSDLRLADRPNTNEFVGRDVNLVWNNNFAESSDPLVTGGSRSSAPSTLYSHNTVRIYDNATNELLREQIVRAPSFVYTFDMNRADSAAQGFNGPRRSLRVEVSVTDTFGRVSQENASRVFTNPVPAAVAPEYFVNGSTIYFNFPDQDDPDYVGVLVWRSLASGFDPATTDPTFDVTGNSLTAPGDADTDYWFRFAAYDAFGKTGLNISNEIHIQTGSNGVDTEPPPEPEGLELSSRIETVEGVVQRQVLTATLAVSEAEDFAYFDFSIRQNNGNWVDFASASNTYEWTVLPEQTYQVRARAVDKMGNPSPYCDPETLVTPPCPELAHLINQGSVSIDGGKIRIQGDTTLWDWRNPGDLTTIDGGQLGTGTVTADKAVFGQRGLTIEGVQFEHNAPAVNRVSWTAGTIRYVGDDGNFITRSIVAGNAQWTSGTLYIYYQKDSTGLQASTSIATAMAPDCVVFAAYRGGTDLVTEYGRTVIDGSLLKTGTVIADQVRANVIEGTHIKAGAIDADHIAANAIDGDKIRAQEIKTEHLAAGAVKADQIDVENLAAISATLGEFKSADSGQRVVISGTLIRVYDDANVERVRMGIW